MAQNHKIVAYPEGNSWIAQALEVDIAAQGLSLNDAIRRLRCTIELERAHTLAVHGEAFHGIGPAPERFLEMAEGAGGAYRPAAEEMGGAEVEVKLAA